MLDFSGQFCLSSTVGDESGGNTGPNIEEPLPTYRHHFRTFSFQKATKSAGAMRTETKRK